MIFEKSLPLGPRSNFTGFSSARYPMAVTLRIN